MARPSPVDCDICGKTLGRKADLSRHMKLHAPNKEELMYHCTHHGCTYKSLQRSNYETHLNTHTGEQPKKCPEEGCGFSSGDPGTLTRHRTRKHGYKPRPNSRSCPSRSTRRVTRQSRRVSPYSSSSSSSDITSTESMSPYLQSPDDHHSCLKPLENVDTCPQSSIVPCGCCGIKNISPSYNTPLATQFLPANDQYLAPNLVPESLPYIPGLTAEPELSFSDYFSLPELEYNGGFYANLPTQQAPAKTMDEVGATPFDNSIMQFDFGDLEGAPVYVPPPASMDQVAPQPLYVAADNDIMGDALASSFSQCHADSRGAGALLPSYTNILNDYSVDVSQWSHGYPLTSLDPYLHPYSFTGPDLGSFSQVLNQAHPYIVPGGPSGLPMQGLYTC